MSTIRAPWVALVLVLTLAPSVQAAEKNGVSPQAISLPSGPGSIEGLGESFEPQLNTGTAVYRVGFVVPPGRAGQAPTLGLSYNGGSGNGIVGIGWSLDGVASIQRQSDKGLPRYDHTDVFVTSGGEELVRLSDGSFRAENEGSFYRYHFDPVANVWTCDTPDGGALTFGAVASARVEEGGRTYRWMITRSEDANGNRIEYAYTSLPGSTNQVFLHRIYYTRHATETLAGEHVVVFGYAGPRPDTISDYRSGFEVTTAHRLARVDFCTRGGSFTPASLCDDVGEAGAARVRSYRLRYDDAGACSGFVCQTGLTGALCTTDAQCVAGSTRLAGVERVGADGVSTLPETTFAYTDYDYAATSWSSLSAFPVDAMAGADAAFVDLNADGLPDVLETPSPGTYSWQENQGLLYGSVLFGAPASVSGPSGQQLSNAGTELADFDGDGLSDLVTRPFPGSDAFDIYPGTGRGSFEPIPRTFQMADFDGFAGSEGFGNPALRLVDVDFDKRIDVVRSVATQSGTAQDLLVRRSAESGSGDELLGAQSCGAIPDALFQDARTFLVDMNGDRLLDLVVVRLTPGETGIDQIAYYPATGHGGYGVGGSCGSPGQPIVLAGDSVDPNDADFASFRQFFWQDVTNDGLGDLIYMGPTSAILWVNRGGSALHSIFLDPYPGGQVLDLCEPSPGCPTPDAVEIADVNGNGTSDIVLLQRGSSTFASFLDLAGPDGVPAHLLREIRNGLGRVTTIEYESSTVDYLEAAAAGAPWKSRPPFPVTVVSAVRDRFGLDLDETPGEDEYLTELRYRDGYYDGFEKEFRGFSEVESIERGDASQPTLVTRNSFHTGAPDGVDNDGDGSVDERTPRGGAEEEPLKGVALEVRQETCTNGPDGDCLVTGDVFTHDFNRWQVRTLYGATGRSCSLDPTRPCCDDAECGAEGAGTCVAVASTETGSLPEDACEIGKSVHWAVSTGTRKALIERGAGPRADLMTEMDYDDYGNRTENLAWGVVDAPDLPGFGCQLTSGVCSGAPEMLCGTDGECGVFGTCMRSSHADGVACSGDPFAFTNTAGAPDERFERTTFANNTTAWQLRCLEETTTETATGVVEARARSYYDDLPLGQCAAGNLTRVEAELIQESRFIPRVRTTYDVFGNAVETLDARDDHRISVFDSSFQTYPVAEIVDLDGHSISMTATYQEGFGVITNATTWAVAGAGPLYQFVYDTFGRSIAEVQPDDSPSSPTSVFEYHLNEAADGISWVTTHRREEPGGGAVDAFAYVDALGRSLGTKQEGDAPGEWIFSDPAGYNRRGSQQSAWLPYFTATPVYETPDPVAAQEQTTRDAMGRELRTTHPDLSFVEHVHRPLATDSLDENDTAGLTPGAHTSSRADGLGRMIEHIERNAGAGEDLLTTWSYDARGNLLDSTDAQGNRVVAVYDSLGRRTSLDDPDRGPIDFLYDDTDNIVETIDARGQRIVMAYDRANRIQSENYLDTTGDPVSDPVDVVYHYDLPQTAPVPLGGGSSATSTFTAGQLVFVQDLSGEEHFSYDGRRRIVWNAKRVRDPETGALVSFTSDLTHDSMDRPTQIGYPDGDRLRLLYGTRGLEQRLEGAAGGREIVGSVSYRPSGQLDLVAYGNGAVTTYGYDARLRLTGITTQGAGQSASEDLLHYAYGYDPVSNVTVIHDLRSSVLPGTPRHDTQRLEYDDLHRLTHYRLGSPSDPNADFGSITYAYDEIDNLILKSSDLADPVANLGTVEYGGSGGRFGRTGRSPGSPPGPHAPTSFVGAGGMVQAYDYDENGNRTEMAGATATWDFKDRLVVLEDAARRTEYVYDHADRRVAKKVTWKSASQGHVAGEVLTTLYPHPNFEVRDGGQPTKFVFLNGTRVAQVTGTLDAGAQRIQRFTLRNGWNLLSVAVDAPDTAVQLGVGGGSPVLAAFLWDPEARDYLPASASTPLPAGSVLWALSDGGTAAVRGSYLPPTAPPIGSPESLVPLGLERVAPSQAAPEALSSWLWDSTLGRWRLEAPGPLASISDAPAVAGPGSALYVRSAAPSELVLPPDSARIRYYHANHLGSSSVVTDDAGRLVEETAFYPYGEPRFQLEGSSFGLPSSNYGFTGKERDLESGLHYFGARYYDGVTATFLSVDPMALSPDAKTPPRIRQQYAYAVRNPMRYRDPTGREPGEEWFFGSKQELARKLYEFDRNSKILARKTKEVEKSVPLDAWTAGVSGKEYYKACVEISACRAQLYDPKRPAPNVGSHVLDVWHRAETSSQVKKEHPTSHSIMDKLDKQCAATGHCWHTSELIIVSDGRQMSKMQQRAEKVMTDRDRVDYLRGDFLTFLTFQTTLAVTDDPEAAETAAELVQPLVEHLSGKYGDAHE